MKFNEKDIEHFFKGKLSENKAKEFLIWLNSKEGEEAYNSQIENLWNKESERDPNLKEAELHTALNTPDYLVTEERSQSKRIKLYFPNLLKVAASLLAILSISYFFYLNQNIDSKENQIAQIVPKEIIRSAPKGQKSKISLPDGSIVFLNAESSIKYMDNFTENRTIYLSGEAFFEVAKNEKYPFEVITENLTTTAIGTSFNINAYNTASKIEVSLASGKVKIAESISQSQVEINPGEGITYSPSNSSFQMQTVDIQNILNWKEGILQFEKLPLPEVIEILERWYGVEIEIAGKKPSPQLKCTGTFKPNEYLSNVLNVLGHSIEFNYTIDDKKITLEFK
jgi:transmembrane sensor